MSNDRTNLYLFPGVTIDDEIGDGEFDDVAFDNLIEIDPGDIFDRDAIMVNGQPLSEVIAEICGLDAARRDQDLDLLLGQIFVAQISAVEPGDAQRERLEIRAIAEHTLLNIEGIVSPHTQSLVISTLTRIFGNRRTALIIERFNIVGQAQGGNQRRRDERSRDRKKPPFLRLVGDDD